MACKTACSTNASGTTGSVSRMTACVLPAVAASFILASPVQAQSTWPDVQLPRNAAPFAVSGGTTEINGVPTRMQGFLSPDKPAEVLDWFRRSMGAPLAESRIGAKLVLGQAQGEHYTTIQLEPAGDGTRGVVAVTSMKEAQESQAREQAIRDRWQARLPAGSRLLSRIASQDGDKQSSHLMIVNSHSPDLNRERITALMREDGMELEHEPTAARASAVEQHTPAERKTLFFKGRGKEAIAVIFRDRSGQTAIVLNTVTTIERFK
jgi:hypothetical protein